MKKIIFGKFPAVDYALKVTCNLIEKNYNKEAKKHNITRVMAFTLLSVDPKEGTKSTTLGPKMGIEPTSLSRTLKNLEKEGLIQREPNPMDGRGVIIKLTPKGLNLRDIAREFVMDFNQQVENKIEEHKLAHFYEVCDQIIELMSENKRLNIYEEQTH